MMTIRYKGLCFNVIFIICVNFFTSGGKATSPPSYLKQNDDATSEDNPRENPQPLGVSRPVQPSTITKNLPSTNLVKNVHYIIPNKDGNRKQWSSASDISQQGFSMPTNNNSNEKRARYLENLLSINKFDFDDSEETHQYRKGHSTRLYSNSYCVKITPLYSYEGACEKELVKIYDHCNSKSKPYETFKTNCYLGSDFVQDKALRLDEYLYSIAPKTLVFMLNDGTCIKKEYLGTYSEPELKDRLYCDEIKRLVRNIEEGIDEKSLPSNMEESFNRAPMVPSNSEGDTFQNDHFSSQQNNYNTETSNNQEVKGDEHEETEESASSNKNHKQEVVNVPEKELLQQKRMPSVVRRLIQKNPLRRLINRKPKEKEFSVVLVYDKKKKPLDI